MGRGSRSVAQPQPVRLILTPDAETDLEEAYRWYEAQRPGFGEEFLSAAQTVLSSILTSPGQYPVIHRETRRALLHRFPYAVLYRLRPDTVIVVAIFHGRRDPRSWESRT